MMNEQKEKEFNAWLESITFVDKNGKVLKPELTTDTSDDPEGDTEYDSTT